MNLLNSLGGLILAGGLFLPIVILFRGGMGEDDVSLIGSLGFVLGIKLIVLNIFLSFVLGGIIFLFLLLTKIKSSKDPTPFGPL